MSRRCREGAHRTPRSVYVNDCLQLNLFKVPFENAELLLQTLNSQKLVDPDADWKLVLFFVQMEDLCICPESIDQPITQHMQQQADRIVQQVEHNLRVLHSQLKRAMVSIVVWTEQMEAVCLTESRMDLKQDDFYLLGNSASPPADEKVNEKSSHGAHEPFHTDSLALQLWANLIMGTEFPCVDIGPSSSPPASVHAVRPADIKVVAAVGDSLTAGNGVGSSPFNLLDVLTQYRGLSWSIGGDNNLSSVTTLPNILRMFNPNVTGFSEGVGKETSGQAFLNQAVPGATSKTIKSQVQALVNRMKTDPRIDFESDWKVITIFIGGNDMCDHCKNSILSSAENFVSRVKDALDFLHREVPRAIVNLVEPLQITPLRRLHQEASLKCPTWLVKILCPCVISPEDDSVAVHRLTNLIKEYQLAVKELVDAGQYDTHENFTVVVQPFLREIVLPLLPDGRPDRSFFSPDCFHLSQKAHSLMARALWNNMLESLGHKTASQDFSAGLHINCPSKASPFIRTYQNSNYTYPGPKPNPPPIANWGSDFSCVDVAPSDSVPTSVHRLRPADVQVVAALGDSVTAGRGAKSKNIFDLSKEYKGVSWSIGGDKSLDTVTTLPNILKKFNPSLKGFSLGQGPLQKGFNMAKAGAKALEIPAQVDSLIKAMKADTKVRFETDWKLVTLFVGGSDLCQYCMDQDAQSPKNYSLHLTQSLDLLYKEVPRLMVNILEVPEIDWLKRVKKSTLACGLLQRDECPCVVIPEENSPEITELRRVNQQYQIETQRLISGGRYDGREDFTVVIQSFLRHPILPLTGDGFPDMSFFSVDCFHLSERTHAEMAIGLWNNMLEPVDRKQTHNNFTYDRTKIQCPTKVQPFIFTRLNSSPPPSTTGPSPAPTSTDSTGFPLTPCPASVPVWVPVVLGIVGLLIGWGATWLLFSWHQRARRVTLRDIIDKKETGF
ncbi:phospholipase B1, membrane-associated-like [Denticeps clupeoides]|uniref:phospholipase B1, membrane-associated-like n=1 Tax=Denticeps clupeoides TaxID=299321 RepID=UPI0010A2B741|nr:phospholipase B1, membrane-associated-like [Denticeps clupeoides]